METKPFSLQAPEAIAKEYGGNKQAIQQAALTGLVDPTAAVLAGMFIDRMRNAAAQEQMPEQTVAQRVFAPPQAQTPAGLGATPQAQQMPPMAPPPAQPTAMLAGGGLADLPVDESMFPDEYAGGGVVAFSTAGSVSDPMFAPDTAQYEEFSSYQPMFPSIGEGNRRYALKQLGYTNEQIAKMPVAQQEFIVQNVATKPAEIVKEEKKAAPGPTPLAAQATPKKDMQLTAAAPTRPTLGATLEEIKGLMPGGKPYEQLEKDLLAEREQRAAGKSQAGWMRLAEAGLNIAAGTSPYALTNIGKGAAEALKGYAADLKDQKKLDREDRKILSDIEKARRDEEVGNVKSAVDRYEKVLDRMSAEDRTRIAAEAAGPEEKLIARYARAKGITFDQAVKEIAAAKAEGKDPMLAMLTRDMAAGKKTVDIRELLKQYPGVVPTR